MKIVSFASVAVITTDPSASTKLFMEDLGIPLERQSGDDEYVYTDKLAGCNHFGVWPLRQAAEACFGTSEWPAELPTPQASIEFEVGSAEAVSEAAQELESRGYSLIHGARLEPWGQTVARWLSREGAILGISYAPWQHTS
jgi:catechol 2,3-dioxygenase-like lactoylglutathione lyase family enzyme